MLYYLVRPFARILLSVWYRKIYCINTVRIPKDAPIIFAINHPTIFIEPCLMACFQLRDLFFLAKSVIFVSPFKQILRSLHIIPIYRRKESGMDAMRKNFTTFEFCYKALKERKAILIMPEGSCIQVKKLRPLSKGIARMAFGSYEKDQLEDLQIIPVGVNFTNPDAIRSEVMLNFGEPIFVKDYFVDYQKNDRVGVDHLIEKITAGMRQVMVRIESPDDVELTEQLWTLYRNQIKTPILPIVNYDGHRFEKEREIAERINQMPVSEKLVLKEKVNQYFEKLKENSVTDFGLRNKHWCEITQILFFLVGLIPFLIGWLGHFIPVTLSKLAGQKAGDVETRMSVILCAFFVVYPLYLATILYFSNGFIGWNGLLITVLFPLLGYFSLLYKERWLFFKSAYRAKSLDTDVASKLYLLRKSLK